MRHSIHLFIGEEMAPIAEAISLHLQKHSAESTKDYAHVACWEKSNGERSVRILGNEGFKVSMENDQQGSFYIADLHDRIINIAVQDSFGDELYICMYIQLYDNSVLDEVIKIIEWCKLSQKNFLLDIYGLASDVAKVFCNSTAEEHLLIKKAESNAKVAKEVVNKIIAVKESEEINRLLILQNCNLNGIGLDLDKNTLIKIIGEYALLTTEQFNDIFPRSDFNKPDVTAFGIAALWFDKFFFTDYLLSHTYLYVMNRENVSQRKMDNPLDLLVRSKKYINENRGLLTSFYQDFIKPKSSGCTDISAFKIETCNLFKEKLDELKNVFLNVMSDSTLTLPEKRAMIALFIREDDELLDDNVLLEELPTVDDCFEESLELFVNEENLYEADGNNPILSGPRNEQNKVYLPLEALKRRKADVRKSQSFIRKCDKRLKAIKEAEQITEDSKKRLTPEGFTYGETTYHLQHDIVEKPLEKTYVPSNQSKQSVDLRSIFSPIRNQGQIGACTAFSTTSIFEFVLNQAENKKKHVFSPRFLYYNVCEKNDDGTAIDRGSSIYDIIESMGQYGVCEEGMCPYSMGLKPPTIEAIENASSNLVTEAKNVTISHTDLTSALSDGYPIVISLKIFNSFGSNNKGFIFRPTEKELKSTDFGYHAMVICGYDEDKKIYIVRNSWGEQFGDKGYCYIPFSYIEDSALCRQACIITGISCCQLAVKTNIDEIINFDEDSYAIEYAITRILKEEEQQNLIVLEDRYNALNAEYIRLVKELTNQGKRGVLIDHAMKGMATGTSSINVKKTENVYTVSKPRFGNEKYFIPIIIMIVALFAYFNISADAAWMIMVIAVAIGVWMFNAKKEETVMAHLQNDPLGESNNFTDISLNLKLLCAGQAIDAMSDFRNELEKIHRYLTSYIGHFSMWLKDEEKVFGSFEDKLKPPFNTILTKKDFENIFNLKKEALTHDIWLWREFNDYSPTEEKARDFQYRLKKRLRTRIGNIHEVFSMCKYMMSSAKYDYLSELSTKHEKWLNEIERQSVPFVQSIGLHPNPRKVLFVKSANAQEEQDWNNYIMHSCSICPTCAFGGSPYKLTYVQMQSLKKNDIKFLQTTHTSDC